MNPLFFVLFTMIAHAAPRFEAPTVSKVSIGQKDVLFSLSVDGERAVFGWGDRVSIYKGTREVSVLRVDGAQVGGGFGRAVALRGDLLVASRVNGFDPNVAYVYERVREVWKLSATLSPSKSIVSPDGFGVAVAIADGRVVVGSPTESAVYVFEKGKKWARPFRLTAPSALLGTSVAASGSRVAAVAQDGVFLFESSKPRKLEAVFATRVSFADEGCLATVGSRTDRVSIFCGSSLGQRRELGVSASGRLADGFGASLASVKGLVLVGSVPSARADAPTAALYGFEEREMTGSQRI